MDTTDRTIEWKRAAMIAAPLLLLLFSLLHGADELVTHGVPQGDEWLRYLSTIQGRWLALHLAGLGLFPLLGVVVWWLLPARRGASRVSRVAIAVYLVLYPAYDALVGIGSYILIHYRQTLPTADRAALDPVIKGLFFDYAGVAFLLGAIASIAWATGAVAAAVALCRDGRWRVGVPLAVAGVAMGVDHAPPFGVMAGLMLGVAVWQSLARERRQPAPLVAGVAPA